MQSTHSSCLFKLGLPRSHDKVIVQNYRLWFKKNAPASMKIWESCDVRFEKSSAAQCYPVKNNRARAPVTTLTRATCICNFTLLLYLDKLMFMSLNYYCQHQKCGLYHSYIRKHPANCCRYYFLFSRGKANVHYYLCFCRAMYFLDDLELHKSLPH